MGLVWEGINCRNYDFINGNFPISFSVQSFLFTGLHTRNKTSSISYKNYYFIKHGKMIQKQTLYFFFGWNKKATLRHIELKHKVEFTKKATIN